MGKCFLSLHGKTIRIFLSFLFFFFGPPLPPFMYCLYYLDFPQHLLPSMGKENEEKTTE